MKSITIHGLDEAGSPMIESRAKANGQSLNKTIKALLEESLGTKPAAGDRYAQDFSEFLGVWGKKNGRSSKKPLKNQEK